MKKKFTIRFATEHDLDAIFRLEEAVFKQDQFSEDQIEYLLTKSRATHFVVEDKSQVAGTACVLWRKSHQSARLYNLAVDPTYQGHGLGFKLMQACETETARRGLKNMTLEVRSDNVGGIRFYERLGYKTIRTISDYYEDGCSALKMSKEIKIKVSNSIRHEIPYFPQTLEFTCGSACLMMAANYFYPKFEMTKALEMTIWKEATLVFMTSGFGGTDGYGLAHSALTRGMSCQMIVSSESIPFLKSVRLKQKKEIIKIIHNDLKRKAKAEGLSLSIFEFGIDEIISALYRNLVPIVLISTYRFTGDRVPHWVVITGFDDEHIYVHDPDIDSYKKNHHKARNIKINKSAFLKMTRYGKEVYRCMILIGKNK